MATKPFNSESGFSVGNNKLIVITASGGISTAGATFTGPIFLSSGQGLTQAVTSFNGLTGPVTGITGIVNSSGISISGTTNVTITNTGVLSNTAGSGINVNNLTGNIVITNTGVTGFNGLTGGLTLFGGTGMNVVAGAKGITLINTGVLTVNGQSGDVNVATLDNAVFTLNGLTGGLTLFGGTGMSVSAGAKGITLINTGVWSFNGLTGAVSGVTGVNSGSGISITGTTNLTVNNTGVTGVNGLTGGLTVFGGTGIQVSAAGKGITLLNTGVWSFNGLTGAVSGVTGVNSGSGISITGTTNLTVNNTGVRSLNGLTGGLTLFGGTGIAITVSAAGITIGNTTTSVSTSTENTFTALQRFSAGISANGATLGNIRIVGSNISTTGTTADIFTNSATTVRVGGGGLTLIIGSTLTNSTTDIKSWSTKSRNLYLTGTGANVIYPFGVFRQSYFKSFTGPAYAGLTGITLAVFDKRSYSNADITIRVTRGSENGAPVSQQINKLNVINISYNGDAPSPGLEDNYFAANNYHEFATGIISQYNVTNKGYTFAIYGITWDTSNPYNNILTLNVPGDKGYNTEMMYVVHTEIEATYVYFSTGLGAGGGGGGGFSDCCVPTSNCFDLCIATE